MSDFNGNWMEAKQKVLEGRDFEKKVPVPMGDEEIKLTHRLMNETELLEVQSKIDQQALMEHQSDGESEEMEELRNLQELDEAERTDEDEKRMTALQKEVSRQQAGLMNSLGFDTFKAFCVAGKHCLQPTEGDIQDVFDQPPKEQCRRFDVDTAPSTKGEVSRLLKDEMVEVVEDQPYPIKFTVGQSAYMESMKLFGDADEDELKN